MPLRAALLTMIIGLRAAAQACTSSTAPQIERSSRRSASMGSGNAQPTI
jgi:hypothetical protein